MGFIKTPLAESIVIKHIVSLHYFEFSKDSSFEGKKHDCWEFLYVDKGKANVLADSKGFILKQGDIIFHQPNEFHSVRANSQIAPNIIVVSFECKSKNMAFFERKILSLNTSQRNILAQILHNGFQAFSPPFNDPAVNTINRKEDAPMWVEQLIKINLEMLLIDLMQKGDSSHHPQRISFVSKERSEDDLAKQICVYMEQNIENHLTMEQICRKFNLSKSHAVNVFKEKTGKSIVKYYKDLVINQAKQMIREEKYNFTQIAEILNYNSIHGFSRNFKNFTGMTPSEYAEGMKAI